MPVNGYEACAVVREAWKGRPDELWERDDGVRADRGAPGNLEDAFTPRDRSDIHPELISRISRSSRRASPAAAPKTASGRSSAVTMTTSHLTDTEEFCDRQRPVRELRFRRDQFDGGQVCGQRSKG
jgi:hypothetical protein